MDCRKALRQYAFHRKIPYVAGVLFGLFEKPFVSFCVNFISTRTI